MEKEYRDAVEFLVVYIHEAHAVDGAAPMGMGGKGRFGDGPLVEEPVTLAERKAIAQTCSGTLDMSPLRMLVDDMKDTAATAYAAHPDRLYLVGRDGKLVYAGGRGPMGFRPDELEDSIREMLGLEPKKRERSGGAKFGGRRRER